MKRRMKKFSEGGEIPDFSRLTFKEAFAAARGGPGVKTPMNKTFTWNGKTYNTDIAADKSKASPKPEPKTEAKAETKAESKAESKSESKPAPKVEDFSAAGNKLTYGTSKAPAIKGKEPAATRERIEPHMGDLKDINPRKPADTSTKRLGVSNAPRLGGRGSGGGGGGGGSGTRQLMLGSDLDPKTLMRENRSPRDDDESRFADEGNPNFKRGGKVKKYAKGGSVGSASKRADGIATKGKTRGKIY